MSSGLTFTHGLILGQLSVLIAIGAFIKFFIFGEAPTKSTPRAPVKSSRNRTTSLGAFVSRSPSHSLRKKPSTSNVLRPVPSNATNIASILRKTYYQIAMRSHGKETHSTHQPESLDWFNVLLAQTIAQYRQTVYNLKDSSPDRPSILQSLSEALNNPSKRPSFIDHIKITEISMGEEFPIFSNVRVIAVEDEAGNATGGRLQALMDVDLSDDNLTMGIETNLILNYPKPLSAILPVGLSVSVVRFSGTLSISFVPATQDAAASESQRTSGSPKTNLAFSFLPDYRLDLSVKSLIGSRSRLQDVPKIAQLVEARVQAWFEERVVEPRVQVVPLPGLWPRMGKTRVREGQEDDRPVSSEGSKAGNTPRGERRADTFVQPPAEPEHDVQGLRYRLHGFRPRVSSQVLLMEDDDGRMMPGSMST